MPVARLGAIIPNATVPNAAIPAPAKTLFNVLPVFNLNAILSS